MDTTKEVMDGKTQRLFTLPVILRMCRAAGHLRVQDDAKVRTNEEMSRFIENTIAGINKHVGETAAGKKPKKVSEKVIQECVLENATWFKEENKQFIREVVSRYEQDRQSLEKKRKTKCCIPAVQIYENDDIQELYKKVVGKDTEKSAEHRLLLKLLKSKEVRSKDLENKTVQEAIEFLQSLPAGKLTSGNLTQLQREVDYYSKFSHGHVFSPTHTWENYLQQRKNGLTWSPLATGIMIYIIEQYCIYILRKAKIVYAREGRQTLMGRDLDCALDIAKA